MLKKASARSAHTIVTFIERYWWIGVLVASVMTYVLVMSIAYGQSIWFDEGYSIVIAGRPIGELLALTGVDAHPPFYYLLLKVWGGLFGWSEFALRSLSALAAAGGVGMMALLLRRLFTVRIMLAVLPFLVFAPFALRYGYEVRMYSLVALISIAATYVLIRAVSQKKRWLWALYAVLVALGMYTLYLSAAIWIAHVVWLVIITLRQKRPLLKQPWVVAYIGAVLLFLPYITTLYFQLTHSALPGIGSAVTLVKLSGLVSFIVSYMPSWEVGGLMSLGLLMIIGLMTNILIGAWRQRDKHDVRQPLLLMLCMVFVPILFFALTSLSSHPIFTDRYIAHVVLFAYALIGLAVGLGWRYGKRLSAGILLVLSLSMLMSGVVQLQRTGNVNFDRLQHPQTSQLRQSITCDDQTVIVADDPYTFIDSVYYFDGCDLRFYSKDDVQKRGGYAPLAGSALRVSASDTLDAPTVIHLHWVGDTTAFTLDGRYHLERTTTYDKQVVDVYTRNED